MMLPTQDKDLQAAITQELKAIYDVAYKSAGENYNPWPREVVETNSLLGILRALEQRGYHAGLPANIEEALNSGDGVYRP